MRGVCPNCEKECELELRKEEEEYTIRGNKYSMLCEFYFCLECQQDFATADQMGKTLDEGYNRYRKDENIIFPEEIVAIRQKYNASQKAFAKILDLGELTINSYEQGSLASKSVSNLIQLMEKPVNFTDLFEKNKHKLSPFQIRKIENSLSEQSVPLYHVDLDLMVEVKEKYTGYNRPDWEKYIALLQLILYSAQDKLYKMALLKIAFYADFAFFKKNLRSLTGWPYAAIDHGPVPEEWKTILNTAEEAKNLVSEPDDFDIGDLFYLPDNFDYQEAASSFSENELELIKEVTSKLKDKSSSELRELTHMEDAWIETAHASKIDYKYAATLKMF